MLAGEVVKDCKLLDFKWGLSIACILSPNLSLFSSVEVFLCYIIIFWPSTEPDMLPEALDGDCLRLIGPDAVFENIWFTLALKIKSSVSCLALCDSSLVDLRIHLLHLIH